MIRLQRLIAFVTTLACTAVLAAPLAYVPNEGGASVSVIDTASDKVVKTFKVGTRPRGIAVSLDGKKLYISDQNSNSLLTVDTQSGEAGLGLSAAEEAYSVAVARYRAGLGNYLQVLAAETQVLDQKNLRADLRFRELDLSIDLIRALGGGFEEATPAKRAS